MFATKGIYLLCSAILFQQFVNSAEEDIKQKIAKQADSLKESVNSAVAESQKQASDIYKSTSQAIDAQKGLNTFQDSTSFMTTELPTEFNGYSDLFTGFTNDMSKHGVKGLKGVIDFNEDLLDGGLQASQKGAELAKSGFGKTLDIGNNMLGYGGEALKMKMEFEKNLADQGLKSAQKMGNFAKNGFGNAFSAASRFGNDFQSGLGGLFKQGPNFFNSFLSQGQAAADKATGAAQSFMSSTSVVTEE